jgi:Raf kinase inhibitor-like YbhB/YbcL family protein
MVLLFVWAGCDSSGDGPGRAEVAEQRPAGVSGTVATIELTSSALVDGEPIPARYTEDGEDLSPPLGWSAVPESTKELALICDDPDAPSPSRPAEEPWVHWVIYKIPADARALPEGIPGTARPGEPAGVLQGTNSFSQDNVGYRGPAPPKGSGKHRYFFKLYALDAELLLGPEQDKQSLVEAMSGHVIGEGSLVGTYER